MHVNINGFIRRVFASLSTPAHERPREDREAGEGDMTFAICETEQIREGQVKDTHLTLGWMDPQAPPLHRQTVSVDEAHARFLHAELGRAIEKTWGGPR